MSDLMDDPTWDCDYHSRCDNKIIKIILEDLEDCKNIEGINFLKCKWGELYNKNEEDDR